MKKLWAGILILAVLLIIGTGAAMAVQTVHGSLADQLEQAANLSQTDWERAQALAGFAQESWEKYRYRIAALVDHEPLEEINSLFSQLALCQRNAEQLEFAAVCLRLASICSMLEESHSPFWWNLL